MRLSLIACAMSLFGLFAFAGCPTENTEPPPSDECLGSVCGDDCCTTGTFCALDYRGEQYCEATCPDEQKCGDACCGVGQACEDNACIDVVECPEDRQCGDECCGEAQACNEGACEDIIESDVDLILIEERTAGTVRLETVNFGDASCEVENRCIKRSGDREVLRFDVVLQNVGDENFVMPSEQGSTPVCGGDNQYESIIAFEIIDSIGTVVYGDDLRTSCVADADQNTFQCGADLGLSSGSESNVLRAGSCPLADVTNIPMGEYTLRLIVNPNGAIAESSTDNNVIEVPFNIECRQEMCNGVCCPEGKCEEGVCMLPDLTVIDQRTTDSVIFTTEFFAEESCEIFEGCIVQPGERRLMRFDTTTPNFGEADLFLGVPEDNIELFDYSPCHDHFHFDSYAKYRLLDENGESVADGHKQAFCLIDTDNINQSDPGPNYNCSFQGITKGWADTYNSGLDCQWVDVTGVPPGDYVLEQRINSEWVLDELDFTNNISTVTVTIPEDPNACIPNDEVCGDGIDNDCDNIVDNGCPPLTDNTTCATAQEVTRNGIYMAEIPAGAGTSISSCGGSGQSVYFRMGLPSAEVVYLSTYGSEIDTVMTIYKDDCGSVEEVCSDDGCGTEQNHIGTLLDSGNYFIEVRSKSNTGGLVKLHSERAFCGAAESIDGLTVINGDTTDGLNEERPAECGQQGGAGNEAMYFFTTCPGINDVSFETCETEWDTMLEIREGTCASSNAVSCNDDGECGGGQATRFASQLADSLTNTTTGGEGDGLWFIMIDGFSQNSVGPFQMSISIENPEDEE